MPKFKVTEYATITVRYGCVVEADKISDAVDVAQLEGEWERDNFYEAWGDETEYDVEEVEEDD